MTEPILQVENVSFGYDAAPILHGVSFEAHRGELFIIIGPNGSGKTTLLRLLAGLQTGFDGHVDLCGRDLTRYGQRDLARRTAFVPQVLPPDFPFRVRQVVLMGRSPHLGLLALEGPEDLAIADEALAFTGVDHLAERRIAELSGGERQRVFIARAICQQPRLLLLDEPTAALDLAHQVRIMDLMARLQAQKGTTVVMVSHDVNLAAMYADRLLLFKDGRVVRTGRPREVLEQAALEQAYGCRLMVEPSPLGDFPRVTPVPAGKA